MGHHTPTPLRVQFILKQRSLYWNHEEQYSNCLSSGLYNSVQFVNSMIHHHLHHYESCVTQVVDSNGIDREVHHFRPSIVIIEAIWVPPYKFAELIRLHPRVKWVVRLHSELPFLAVEGIAMDWLNQYCQYANVSIAANSQQMQQDLARLLHHPVLYLPNYYDFQN